MGFKKGEPQPWRKIKKPMSERFWPKVEKTDSCWEWRGGRLPNGYGVIGRGGRPSRNLYAHRVSYEMAKGPIPEGLEIDHLCRNRGCVNPDHLEAVTHQKNLRRAMRTHCIHGHEFTFESTVVVNGKRVCLICRRARDRARRPARR